MVNDFRHKTLNSRQSVILATVVEEYIATAGPVASGTVAATSSLKLSPASVRAVMAELTELGYLEQPHTSAGRVPTDKAFRLYVNSLMRIKPLSEADRRRIQASLAGKNQEISDTLRRASAIVSEQCHQVGMVLAPSTHNACLRSIGFASGGENLVVAMLAFDSGLTETRVVYTQERFNADELIRFSNYLNEHFMGLPVGAIRIAILQELVGAKNHLEQVAANALGLACLAVEQRPFLDAGDPTLFVDGTANILDHAEFADLKKMRELLLLLEERSRLLDLLDNTMREDTLKVTFGAMDQLAMASGESENRPVAGLSMVSAPYGGNPRGVVSVIGPTRMDYAKVLPVVDFIAKTLTGLLHSRFQNS